MTVVTALIAIAVIVGLLAMHTLHLNGAAATEQPTAGMSMSMSEHHEVPLAAPAPDVAMCAECGPEGHLGAAMACAIALLLVLLVVVPPGRLDTRPRLARPVGVRGRPRARAFAESLSLHALCISRT